jgi:hypothetical protein
MMQFSFRRAALVVGAAFGVGSVPASVQAQKALVYCPVAADATGCNTIVTALTGPAFPLGVDRGYDGTSGTVDLKTVDLFSYSVFIVPSLADGSTSQPYAKLRDPEVVEHLKAALIGRIAMWSGSPDQGATNRAMKDALIQNLAAWASGAFGTAKGPGLVALLDASSSLTGRYDWVRAIAPVPVTSDGALLIYSGVRALNTRATTILTSGAGPIVYDNMATFGFQVPNGAAGVSLDAVGQTGTAQGGQVVLLTVEAGNSTGAVVKTDKDDYAPGTTVVITGSGWEPNETVKLSLHMDPLRDADTELSAVADAQGRITNTDFAPREYDIGVRFVLTAVGQTSGRRAQATFTDDTKLKNSLTVTPSPQTVAAGGSATYTVTVSFNGGAAATTGCTAALSVTTALPAGVTATFNPVQLSAINTVDKTSTLTLATSAGSPSGSTTFTVRAQGTGGGSGANDCSATDVSTGTATVTIGAPPVANTTTSVTSSANPSAFGESVTFTATVSATSGTPTGTVLFKDGGTTLGTGALAGGQATFATSNLSVATHPITAEYQGAPGSFNPSTSSPALSQVVNKAPTTTTLASSLNPSTFGQSVTFTAAVAVASPGVGIPTGTVEFKEGGTVIGTGTLATDGGAQKATFATSTLTVGTHNITASYVTSTSFAASTSTPALAQIVNPVATTLTVDPATGTYGETVDLKAKLTNGSTALSGKTITFTLNGTICGTADTDSNGEAKLAGVALTGINAGTYSAGPTSGVAATFAAEPTYSGSTASATLTVNKRLATWTTQPATKVYGDPDPTPLTTGAGANFISGDVVTATYTRVAGETVAGGPYHVTATLSATPAGALDNYTVTNAGADFTITKRRASWTTDPKSKTYGDADPSPLTTGSGSNFVDADGVSATYSRVAGETVAGGPYAITATLAATVAGALDNYTITNTGASFTIDQRLATWTTNANSKTFGAADPVPVTSGSGSNFVAADGVTATYARAPGETVLGSPYQITATLSASVAGALANYTITNTGAAFTIKKATPTILWTGLPATVNQGDALTSTHLNAVAQPVISGPNVSGAFTYTILPSTIVTAGTQVFGAGVKTVRVDFASSDGNYTNATDTRSLTVDNVKPTVLSIALPSIAIPLGSTANMSAKFIDPGLTDTHEFSVDWDWDLFAGQKTPNSDTSPFVAVTSEPTGTTPATAGTANASYAYKAPGVYTVHITVKDNYGATGERTSATELFAYVIVYDPSAGFVTGGGWIDSPPGACRTAACSNLTTGKANFGFVSKYKKGQTAPEGNTEFQFKAGDINFHSSLYEWLVVSGAKAQFKGTGTINGSGNYGFLLSAIDGQVTGGGGTDKFRIKIWDKNKGDAIVYDNQLDAADDSNPTTVLGGGSINIQAK